MTTRKATKAPKTLEQLLDDLFDYAGPESLNEDLWDIFVTSMNSEITDSWSASHRGDMVLTFKRVTDFFKKAGELMAVSAR